MHVKHLLLATALLASAAQARPPEDAQVAAPRLSADSTGRYGPIAEGFKRYTPLYGENEAANPNDRQFSGFRTDPRLVLGYAFTKNFAIEAGYAHLRDEGFHKIEPGPVEQAVAAGALGAKSHTTYVAAKVTLPLSERLSVYGKFGVAQSQLKDDGLLPRGSPTVGGAALPGSDEGAYGAVGATFRVNKRTTVSGEIVGNGSARKFDNVSNASGLKGSVGIGF
jgi:hypothetical protein